MTPAPGDGRRRLRGKTWQGWTRAEIDTLVALADAGGSFLAIADALAQRFGVRRNPEALRMKYREAQRGVVRIGVPTPAGAASPAPPAPPATPVAPDAAPAPGVPRSKPTRTWRESSDGTADLTVVTDRPVRTLEDLLAVADVDLDVWEVREWRANAWEVGAAERAADGTTRIVSKQLHQVACRLVRRGGGGALDVAALCKALAADLRADPPPRPRVRRVTPTAEPHTLVVNLVDVHLGALAWAPETGQAYDLAIAADRMTAAVARILGRAAPYGLARVVLRTGDDLLHIDGEAPARTTSGTPQDADGRLTKIVRAARAAIDAAVAACLTVAPAVDVVWIAGNHDRITSPILAHAIDAAWARDARVTVDLEPRARKYRRIGRTLFGFTHGDGAKAKDLPLLMAREAPDDWAAATFHEWRLGHWHRVEETEHAGVRVRVAPSLKSTDAWHHLKGYAGTRRALEADVVHDAWGPIARVSVTVEELEALEALTADGDASAPARAA